MSITEEVVAERKRQINVEGYTPDHDDIALRDEDLMEAAIAYYAHATGDVRMGRDYPGDPPGAIPKCWPWAAEVWKPKTPRRDLIRAGALCLAEQEWCLRQGLPKQKLPEIYLQRVIEAVEAIDAAPSTDPAPATP